MWKSPGRTLALAAGMLGTLLLGSPGLVSGQALAVGGHVTMNRDLTDETTWGIGGRAQLGMPLTGITIQGTADFYSPDCGTLECDLNDVSVNLLWSLPVPHVANPYLGAGLAMQNADGSWAMGEDTDYGLNLLAGIVLQGPTFNRFQPFVEARYQAMQDFDSQLVFSGGILLKIF